MPADRLFGTQKRLQMPTRRWKVKVEKSDWLREYWAHEDLFLQAHRTAADVLPKPRPAMRHSGVLDMGIIEGYRGRGIGRSLMRTTLEAAKAKGMTRIELTVRVDNPVAKRLYEALGFIVEGLCRRHMRIKGEYHDSYLMALLDGTNGQAAGLRL